MNKKIIVSMGVIGVAAAAVIGGTIAYFNDTETSTGNIFTAGSIDLKVDHVWQTYNDVDCQTCDVTIQSDTSNLVVAKSPNAGDPTALSHAAVEVLSTTITDQYWTATVPNANAKWIWATEPVLMNDVLNTVTYTFQNTFEWYGPFTGALVSFSVASDNSYKVFLNGDQIAADPSEDNHSISDPIVLSLTPYIENGVNTIQFEVTNWAQVNGSQLNNPAGLLYSLVIDGDCESNYFLNHCSLWGEKDLEDGDTFFNFTDVKPGDLGVNIISLHVFDNDAWACLIADDFQDEENVLMEPEADFGDESDGPNEGELSNYLNAYVWHDDNQNGIPDGSETIVGNSLIRELGELGIFDSSQEYLNATTTKYVGIAWCAGDISFSNGLFTCDGSTMKDDAQSDSFTATLTAYAEQWRNNQGFLCSDVDLNPGDQVPE